MELTEKEISAKYFHIENKIPGTWGSWVEAGVELSQDICMLWDIKDSELIRVISLVSSRVPGLNITQHIYAPFSFMGLYPHVQKSYNITPDKINE
jgi:hypothetical protein